MAKIFLVEDHKNTRLTLTTILKRAGHSVAVADSGQAALEILAREYFDIMITDLKLGDIDGIEVLSQARQISPDMDAIVITAFGAVATAVKAMKMGAYDYIAKPVQRDEILLVVNKLLKERRQSTHVCSLQRQSRPQHQFEDIIAGNAKMRAVLDLVREVAPIDAPVLILGESGTGKELIATSIHQLSVRSEKPFIAINCGAMPENLQESELFGHLKGSFTGASSTKKGLFEVAKHGTILFDEIGEMSLSTQVKLLRVIQNGEVRPVGGHHVTHVNVRILSATNQDLNILVEKGHFRSDLLFRINVVPIHLPPLRERLDDLPAFTEHFIRRFANQYRKPVTAISSDALRELYKYHWPGNIRELEHLIERAIILCKTTTIEINDLRSFVASSSNSPHTTLNEQEKQLILKSLKKNNWNQTRSAAELGISTTTLWRRIKKYGL